MWQFSVSKAYFKEHSWIWGEERETNKIQLIWCLLSNFYLNMFQASLWPSSGEQDGLLSNFYLNMFQASVWPSSGEQDNLLPHVVFCTGCAGLLFD